MASSHAEAVLEAANHVAPRCVDEFRDREQFSDLSFFFLQIFLFSGFRTFLYCRDAFFELFLSDVEKSIRSNRDRLQIRFLS